MNTRTTLAAIALAAAGLAAACAQPAQEGPITAIEPMASGGCVVTIGGEGGEGTEDANHEAPARFCSVARVGDHAEFEDGDVELGFTEEADD
jgi:hypothetical protein